jgi:hypothetical protein
MRIKTRKSPVTQKSPGAGKKTVPKSGFPPASAVQDGLAPYFLPGGKMDEAIAVCVKNYLVHTIPAPLPAPWGKHPFIRILMLLRSWTGYHFSLYKQNSIHCPIEQRRGVHTLSDNTVLGFVRRRMSLNSRRIHNKTGCPRFILPDKKTMCPFPKKADKPPCCGVIPS